MEFDLNRFKSEGIDYINLFIKNQQDEEWENLKFAKLQNCGPEELDLMYNLWSHGFSKGAETSIKMSMALYESNRTRSQS